MNVDINFAPMGPELIIIAVATLVLILDIVLVKRYRDFIGYFALAGILGALAYLLVYFGTTGDLVLSQLAIDDLSIYIRLAILIIGATIVLAALKNEYAIQQNQGEFFALLLYSLAGTMIMASARDLVTLYIGLELSTIPTFILVAFRKAKSRAAEALIKFFVLGLLSSAFLIYGLSLIYGLTGELNLTKIAVELGTSLSPALVVGALLIIAGLGFKITAVPFHFWAPDTYEGSPVIVISYLASVSKLGAFAVIARIFIEALPATQVNWALWFGFLATITMVLGNLMALPQMNIKRMMAYSGIGHSGYLLVGLAVGTNQAIWSMFFYLFAYVFAATGVFFIMSIIANKGEAESVSDYEGLYQTNPVLALLMTMFLFSLVGLPPFAGFIGKFYLANAAVQNHQTYLALLIFLNSLVSVGYYIKIIKAIYLKEPNAQAAKTVAPITATFALVVPVIAIFYLTIRQDPFLHLAKQIFSTVKL